MGELYYFHDPSGLTPEQEDHWVRQLEAAEKAVRIAKHMLGLDLTEPVHDSRSDSDTQ